MPYQNLKDIFAIEVTEATEGFNFEKQKERPTLTPTLLEGVKKLGWFFSRHSGESRNPVFSMH